MKKQIPLIVVILLLTVYAIFVGTKKEWFHVDEAYSYHFISEVERPSINEGRPGESYRNVWHDPSYYQEYFIVSSEEAFDIKGVYRAIVHDAHPPLYYILFHLVCSVFFRNTFSFWSGLLLNLVFFILTLIFLYLLSEKILRSRALSISAVALYGFSAGAMDTFTLIRMYMTLTFFCVLFVYANVLLREQYLAEERSAGSSVKCYILLFVSSLLGMLTQYYFIVFAFFVCTGFWALLLLKKNYRRAAVYALTEAAALLCACAIWPDTVPDMIGGSSAGHVIRNVQGGGDLLGKIREYIRLVSEDLFGGLLKAFLVLLLAVFLLVLIKRRFLRSDPAKDNEGKDPDRSGNRELKVNSPLFGREFVPACLITVSSALFFLFTALTAPFIADRYVSVLYPFIILIVVFILKCLLKEFRNVKVLSVLFAAVLMLLLIRGYKEPGLRYLYHNRAAKMTALSEYKDAPSVFVNNDYKPRTKSAELSPYWRNMENGIYVTVNKDLSKLEGIIPDSRRLIVFIDRHLKDPKGVMREIKRISGKKKASFLWQMGYARAYVLE